MHFAAVTDVEQNRANWSCGCDWQNKLSNAVIQSTGISGQAKVDIFWQINCLPISRNEGVRALPGSRFWTKAEVWLNTNYENPELIKLPTSEASGTILWLHKHLLWFPLVVDLQRDCVSLLPNIGLSLIMKETRLMKLYNLKQCHNITTLLWSVLTHFYKLEAETPLDTCCNLHFLETWMFLFNWLRNGSVSVKTFVPWNMQLWDKCFNTFGDINIEFLSIHFLVNNKSPPGGRRKSNPPWRKIKHPGQHASFSSSWMNKKMVIAVLIHIKLVTITQLVCKLWKSTKLKENSYQKYGFHL